MIISGGENHTNANIPFDKDRGLYKKMITAVEKPLLEDVLFKVKGNQLKAARILGINRNTLRAKIKKYGIDLDMIRYRNSGRL